MITILLYYLFYFVLPARVEVVCSLWVSQPPSAEQVFAACGEIDLTQYEVQFVNIWDHKVWCIKNASAIYAPYDACHFSDPPITLDNFRMEITQTLGEQVLCSVKSLNKIRPEFDEIRAACGELPAEAELRFVAEVEPEPAPSACQPPAPAPGPGLLDQPAAPADLATEREYHLLAGQLIWWGYAVPQCDGLSGVDFPSLAATPCGMTSARPVMLAWQNQYDADIYRAAARYNVPPRLLKELIARETQFWPQTGAAGEVGLVQLTEDGIDLMFYQTLPGYALAGNQKRAELRAIVKQKLTELTTDDFYTYAQALAAYYCAYGSWDEALKHWNVKHERIIDNYE